MKSVIIFAGLLIATTTTAQTRILRVGSSAYANFHTVQAAVDAAPTGGVTLFIEPGTYKEKLHINAPNVRFVGAGASPADTVLTWNDSAKQAGGTSKSGSVTITADGFEAENLTISNTWWNENTVEPGAEGAQAVALLMSSDRAVLDRVRLLSGQDTLYANSLTCRTPQDTPCQASRQFFNDCYIAGHVDFIFGDAKAVFNHCELRALHHPQVMLTAQSRLYPQKDSGYYFLHCTITGEKASDKIAFGRPWRDYSTVTFYDTDIRVAMVPEGWWEWNDRLKTSTYREYKSHGVNVDSRHRAVVSGSLSKAEEKALTPEKLLQGTDSWHPEAEIAALRKLALQARKAH